MHVPSHPVPCVAAAPLGRPSGGATKAEWRWRKDSVVPQSARFPSCRALVAPFSSSGVPEPCCARLKVGIGLPAPSARCFRPDLPAKGFTGLPHPPARGLAPTEPARFPDLFLRPRGQGREAQQGWSAEALHTARKLPIFTGSPPTVAALVSPVTGQVRPGHAGFAPLCAC